MHGKKRTSMILSLNLQQHFVLLKAEFVISKQTVFTSFKTHGDMIRYILWYVMLCRPYIVILQMSF